MKYVGRHETSVAAVTGGTQGLGLAIASRLISDGCRSLTICGRSREKGEAAARKLAALTPGGSKADVRFIRADLEKPVEAVGFIEQTIPTWRRGTVIWRSISGPPFLPCRRRFVT